MVVTIVDEKKLFHFKWRERRNIDVERKESNK